MTRQTERKICWPRPDATCIEGGCLYCADGKWKTISEIEAYCRRAATLVHRGNRAKADPLAAFAYGRDHGWGNAPVRGPRQPAFIDAPPAPPARRGAAGVLLRHVDPDGQEWYLLGRRARHMRNGGTWANIGGFLDTGEAALTGALREFSEEMGLPAAVLRGATISKVIEFADDRVCYTTFVLDVVTAFEDGRLSDEVAEAWWITPDEIDTLCLHPRFAPSWKELRA